MAQSDDKPLDQEALAEAYNRALALEKAGDFDAAAKAYEEVLQIDPDDHGGAAVRLASMGRGAVPLKAPDAYVATLFDQHAEMFDTILVDQLGYDVPLQLREMLLEMDDAFNAERMLDLGCGAGLSADALPNLTCAPCWTVTEWIASAVRTSLCVASKALRCRAISILHAAVDRLHREC